MSVLRRLSGSLCALTAAVLLAACVSEGTGMQLSRLKQPNAAEKRAQNAAVQTRLAMEYMRSKDYRSAIAAIETAQRQQPENADTWLVSAEIYRRIGLAAKAGQAYRQALTLAPDLGEPNNNYGWFLCNDKQQPQQAQHYFDRALADPTYPTPQTAYLNKGMCAAKNGQFQAALASLQHALQLAPDFAPAYLAQAQSLFALGDLNAAEHSLNEYLRRTAQPDTAALQLAQQLTDKRSRPENPISPAQ